MKINVTITDILALWGALLSTILAIRQYIQDKPKLTISCAWNGTAIIGGSNAHDPIPETMIITIANTGHRPIILTNITIMLSNKTGIWKEGNNNPLLPIKLEAGEFCVFTSSIPDTKSMFQHKIKLSTSDITIVGVAVTDISNKTHIQKLPNGLKDFYQDPKAKFLAF